MTCFWPVQGMFDVPQNSNHTRMRWVEMLLKRDLSCLRCKQEPDGSAPTWEPSVQQVEHGKLIIEDARTKRGSGHIGCKLRKIAKTLCPCLYFTMLCLQVSLTHTLNIRLLWLTQYAYGRNWSPVAETDTNSVFKIF